MKFIIIIIGALITNNIIFTQTTGICPFLGVSKKMKSAVSMGLSVIFIMTLSTLVCWVMYNYVLKELSLIYLQTIVFILIIACLVQLLDIILKRFSPTIYNSLGIYLALITTNCAVLGTANQVIRDGLGLLDAVVTAAAVGGGFMLALILMAGVRESLETANVPKFFKGFPITLIAAAIMAMAFYGFSGIDEALKAIISG